MDLKKRNTKKYSFKEPDLSRLRELGALVPFPEDFQKLYGKLLTILNTNVEEGILNTLVQFYDPIYHCFTFVDYQLVPTLEEYSYWVGLPISERVPYTGLEEFPAPSVIANALHLKTSDIVSSRTKKGGFQGLTSNFLFGRAFGFAKNGDVTAFEAILALLIYGLVLFPNIDSFVDNSAIQIFLGGNPVPTLLADAYHSIHHRTHKGEGLILCCAPLLYRWFISHLPRTRHFKENPEKLRWAQRIMPLTSFDIVWYDAAYDIGVIIDGCGEFSNVPLLGTRGGISYNPTLARRQKGKDQLGKKLGIVSEDYTKWVISRAIERGMPYSFEKSSSVDASSSITPPSVIPFKTIDEFQELLAKLRLEKDAWERKFRESELENQELKEKLKEQEKVLSLQSDLLVEKKEMIRVKDALLRQDSKRKKRQGDLFSSGLDSLKVARRIRYKPTRVYNTRFRLRNKMSNVEEENHMLREQVTTMQTEIEKLTSMVASLMATQNQVPAPVPQSSSTFVPPPVSSAPFSTPQYVMPEGYPWGMPVGFLGDESRPVVSEIPHVQSTVPIPQLVNTLPQVTATVSAPVIHTIPQTQMPIFHAESVGGYDRMDDLQIKYDEMQKEMRALRGKDLFGQDAHELCLVPDVVVPHKFKVPDFEKYKGSTCPKAHLIMYARKMSTQTSNDKLLIHYFQDSLTGAALRWYMDLDRANVSSFNDLASAFIRQYNYNSYLAPDRDELRALAQKERESFKEYAQRWRELAAQIRPPVEEKELCKLFLHTLSPFFYEKMVGIVSRSFTEMVEMGMCLEEGVRQGRLIKENAPTSTTKKYGNSFSKKKESEVGMVAQGGPQSRYLAYQHVSAITPTPQPQITQAPPPQYPHPYQQPYPQQPQIRPQTPQQPYNYPNRTQRNPPFDPIPMKYADLLPALLAKNFVQTRPPPTVPAVLPTWYRSDLTCAFHQGAPGHDVERCYALKKAVQELIRNKVLSFKDENPNVRNNPLPNHGSSVHFIQDCQETSTILSVKDIKTPLVSIHSKMCEAKLFSHDHVTCEKCLKNPQGCSRVQEDIQRLMDKGELVVTKKSEDVCVIVPEFNASDRLEMIYNSGEPTVNPLVICLPGPMPYTPLRAVPYRYDATMLQDGVEIPIPPLISVDNIADNSKILRSGRILPGVVQGKTGSSVEKAQIPDSSGTSERVYEDSDEVLKMIKRKRH
ncbi:hypothetical protein TSUD_61430 [Trifolium subterraneum]|uniref:Uncharacterized protein n=1 Tax=Trifolium subterraneum TaxID=3900 RepID=A0A2Z6P107_TRISU|nr:hypothetical protein TSUD_61430 [Trifolium subterraneum]